MTDIFAKVFTQKRIYIILGIFVVANILTTVKIVSDRTFFNSSDFIAYSIGAQMILDGKGKSLYDIELQTRYFDEFLKPLGVEREDPYILPYLAPPLTATLFIPYTFLPYNMQYTIGLLVGIFAFFIGALILGKTIKNIPLALLVVFSSWFVWVCVWQVQPTVWLFLVTALLYKVLHKQNYALAGFLSAFYIIKPQYLIIVPLVFILTNKSRLFLKTFLPTFALFVLINLLLSSPQTLFVDYPKFLSFTDNPNYGNRWYEMYSIQQLTYRFSHHFSDQYTMPILAGLILYLAGLIVLIKNETVGANLNHRLSVAIILTTLTAYHVLPQDISLIAIPTLLTLSNSRSSPVGNLLLVSNTFGLLTTTSGIANYQSLLYLSAGILSSTVTNKKKVETCAKID